MFICCCWLFFFFVFFETLLCFHCKLLALNSVHSARERGLCTLLLFFTRLSCDVFPSCVNVFVCVRRWFWNWMLLPIWFLKVYKFSKTLDYYMFYNLYCICFLHTFKKHRCFYQAKQIHSFWGDLSTLPYHWAWFCSLMVGFGFRDNTPTHRVRVTF